MANLTSNKAMYDHLSYLAEQHIVTDDDQLVFDALKRNDIQHACQPVRDAQSDEIKYQHLTLRFGLRSEQSVYQYELSEEMQKCLDLFGVYLALRQVKFQLDTFHPHLISRVVIPIRAGTLLWEKGDEFLNQIIQFHKQALKHMILSLQTEGTYRAHNNFPHLIKTLKRYTSALWFEFTTNQTHYEHIAEFSPDIIKLSMTIEDKQDHHSFLPMARFLRRHKLTWVAGRVSSQNELNRYRLLGARYYFGYFSDIPNSSSFKSFDSE